MRCLNCGVELETGDVGGLCVECLSNRIVVPPDNYQRFKEHVENPEIRVNERLDRLIEKFQPQLSLREYIANIMSKRKED